MKFILINVVLTAVVSVLLPGSIVYAIAVNSSQYPASISLPVIFFMIVFIYQGLSSIIQNTISFGFPKYEDVLEDNEEIQMQLDNVWLKSKSGVLSFLFPTFTKVFLLVTDKRLIFSTGRGIFQKFSKKFGTIWYDSNQEISLLDVEKVGDEELVLKYNGKKSERQLHVKGFKLHSLYKFLKNKL